MRYLIILSLLTTWCFGAEIELSPKAAQALKTHEVAVGKADALHEKAVAKSLNTLTAALKKEQVRVTKKGDLDGANAIAAVLKKFEEEEKNFLGELIAFNPHVEWVGSWAISVAGFKNTWEVNKDGNIQSGTGNSGKWKIAKNLLRINWSSGHTHDIEWPITKGSLSGKEGGKTLTGTKQVATPE